MRRPGPVAKDRRTRSASVRLSGLSLTAGAGDRRRDRRERCRSNVMFRTLPALTVLLIATLPVRVAGQPPGRDARNAKPAVEVTLSNYFQETVTRPEAVNRLRGRGLPADAARAVEATIPERTEHFVSLDDGTFREYARVGDGPVEVLLILPLEKVGNIGRGDVTDVIPASHRHDGKPALRRPRHRAPPGPPRFT